MDGLLDATAAITPEALRAIAHMPTDSLPVLMSDAYAKAMTDTDFMRVAFFLAEKSLEEGGCPIGAVIIDTATRRIVGKGHNTLVQESHPYNHGETSAMRDAGRIDFSRTTLFTSLSPCDVCTALIVSRGFPRVVVGDVTNTSGNEALLRERGIEVDILEQADGVARYTRYRQAHPDLDLEDWKGVAALDRGDT